MEIIVDGTGTGNSAKVDETHRLHVDSVATQREEAASQKGSAFNVNTGSINLTNASTANGVLYIKNNENYNLIITNIFYILGNSTGGSGDLTISIIKNPTAGTLISGATDVDTKQNKNFGSSRIIDLDAYKGATGLTVTNGVTYAATILNTGPQRVVIAGGSITLPKASSIAIVLNTPVGNTSMNCMFAISCYLEDEVNQFK